VRPAVGALKVPTFGKPQGEMRLAEVRGPGSCRRSLTRSTAVASVLLNKKSSLLPKWGIGYPVINLLFAQIHY